MSHAPYATQDEVKVQLGVVDNVDNDRIDLALAGATAQIDGYTRRRFDLVTGSTRLFNGNGSYRLHVGDVLAVTAITLAPGTGATPAALASGSYFLGPAHVFDQGRPYEYVDLSSPGPGYDWVNSPIPGPVAYGTYGFGPQWYRGYQNVAITGDWGWPEVPDDVKLTCISMAIRWLKGARAGFSDVIGVDDAGAPTFTKSMSSLDRDTLKRYRRFVFA